MKFRRIVALLPRGTTRLRKGKLSPARRGRRVHVNAAFRTWFRKRTLFSKREVAAPVVHKHRHELVVNNRRHHQIDGTVAVYILGRKQQAAEWRCKSNRGTRSKAQLQVNRIPRISLGIRVDLNRGKVRLLVAIKIANRKMGGRESGTCGPLGRAREIQIGCHRGFSRSSEQRQTER